MADLHLLIGAKLYDKVIVASLSALVLCYFWLWLAFDSVIAFGGVFNGKSKLSCLCNSFGVPPDV